MIHQVARRVAELDYDNLSESTRQKLSLLLLANLSVGVAGVPHCVFARPTGVGGYRLLSGDTAARATDAAFWNAAAMHARTQDDFHPVGNNHIGTVVIPAMLAVTNEVPISGQEFLSAMAAGYMVAVGLSRGSSPVTTPRGLRSTALYCPFAATAAVGKLRKLEPGRIAAALALAVAFTGGTTQTWIDGSDEWQLHVAHAAEAGLRSIDYAKAGVVGGSQALDGEAGFFHALTGRRLAFSDIASDFEPSTAINEIVIKRYPVSGICQSLVLASERIAAQLPQDAKIAHVVVEMNSFEMNYPGTLNRGPFHSFSSKLMSANFCTASTLVSRQFSFGDFQREASPELKALADRVDVVADAELPLLSCRLTAELKDGRVFRELVRNSKAELDINWTTVDAWASSLWIEGGRTVNDYENCRLFIQNLSEIPALEFPI
jgi:2-methylcitrate dehydratase PrpD